MPQHLSLPAAGRPVCKFFFTSNFYRLCWLCRDCRAPLGRKPMPPAAASSPLGSHTVTTRGPHRSTSDSLSEVLRCGPRVVTVWQRPARGVLLAAEDTCGRILRCFNGKSLVQPQWLLSLTPRFSGVDWRQAGPLTALAVSPSATTGRNCRQTAKAVEMPGQPAPTPLNRDTCTAECARPRAQQDGTEARHRCFRRAGA